MPLLHGAPTRDRFGLGRLYRRTGKPEQTQEHLSTATAMYGEMGMTNWLEKLETQEEAFK